MSHKHYWFLPLWIYCSANTQLWLQCEKWRNITWRQYEGFGLEIWLVSFDVVRGKRRKFKEDVPVFCFGMRVEVVIVFVLSWTRRCLKHHGWSIFNFLNYSERWHLDCLAIELYSWVALLLRVVVLDVFLIRWWTITPWFWAETIVITSSWGEVLCKNSAKVLLVLSANNFK